MAKKLSIITIVAMLAIFIFPIIYAGPIYSASFGGNDLGINISQGKYFLDGLFLGWQGIMPVLKTAWSWITHLWNTLVWSWFKYIWMKIEPVYQQRKQIFEQEFPKNIKELSSNIKSLPEIFKNLWDGISQ